MDSARNMISREHAKPIEKAGNHVSDPLPPTACSSSTRSWPVAASALLPRSSDRFIARDRECSRKLFHFGPLSFMLHFGCVVLVELHSRLSSMALKPLAIAERPFRTNGMTFTLLLP